MAALVVQSRFAGLKIEDDDFPPTDDKPKKTRSNNSGKKPEPAKKNNKNNTKPQSASKKKKSKAVSTTSEQWEQWKQKDEELVDGNYESELQQAILLSKLDYEEKKDVYTASKKEAEAEKKVSETAVKNSGKKQQKKKNVMSLEQFNDMVTGADEPKSFDNAVIITDEAKSPTPDPEFFERVKDEAKNELLKDKINDRVRNRKAVSDEVITRVQFADALEKKDQEIAALKLEVSGLKEELLTVKSRNKKLCNILGQGEMKEKAEVLVEVERLRAMQGELTAELHHLHSELQRERSRHPDTHRTRDKKKKSANEKEK